MTDSNPNSSDNDHQPPRKTYTSILPKGLSGGPQGVGDPNDRTLRKAEIQFMVTDVVRKESQKLCKEEMRLFAECTQKAGLLCTFKCKEETNNYNNCLLKWKNDPEFFEMCTEKYLDMRSEYRRTGVGKSDIRHRVNRAQRVAEAKEILEEVKKYREEQANQPS